MRWMTVREVASCCQHSKQWVHNRIKDGTFKAETKGRRVDVDGSTVQNWMVQQMEAWKQGWKHYAQHLPEGYHGEPEED
jgi:predicted DNA-binding transcriptional regulator AlpA